MCIKCPSNSIKLSRASQTCTCKGGYRQDGEKDSVVCTVCPAGTYSTAGNETCTDCPAGSFSTEGSAKCTLCPQGYYSSMGSRECSACGPGYYSDRDGQSSCIPCQLGSFSNAVTNTHCTLCEQGTYADSTAQSKCTACGTGEITPIIGATIISMCVNPTPNFTIGVVALVLVVVLIYIYLLRGRLQKIAFERRVLYVEPLAKVCHKINKRLIKNMTRQQKKRTWSSTVRVSIFFVLAMFCLFVFICTT